MELIDKLRAIKERFDKIDLQLADPGNFKNQEKIISLSKERSELLEFIEVYNKYEEVLRNIEGNKEIIEDE